MLWITRVRNARAGNDFRTGFWGPARALVHGVNPFVLSPAYVRLTHVDGPAPLYVPLTWLVHLPIAFVSHGRAPLVGSAIGATLTWAAILVLLPPTSTRRCLLATVLGVVIFLSAPVQESLFLGQQAPWIFFGLALVVTGIERDRLWLAAIGVALAGMKPQTAIPLALALVMLGHWRVAVRAGVIAAVGSVPALVAGSIAAGSPLALVRSTSSSWKALNDATTNRLADSTNNRVDGLGALSHLGGPGLDGVAWTVLALVVFSALAAVVLVPAARRLGSKAILEPWVAFVVVAYVVLAMYHQPYDMLIVFVPVLLAARAAVVTRPVLLASLAVLATELCFRLSVQDRLASALDVQLQSVKTVYFVVPTLVLVAAAGYTGAQAGRDPRRSDG